MFASSLPRSLSILLIGGALCLSACKEEQILYETDQPSTTGPNGGTALPSAAGSIDQALAFQRPPERELLSLDALKSHTVVGLEFNIPRAWTFAPSQSPMRAAEIRVPPAAGSTDGVDIVVFYFGQGQGGSAAMNINRWLGQVQLTSGEPASLYQQRSNGLVVSEVIARGTYTPTAMGPGAPAQPPIANAILRGVVVEDGPQGSVFIRATGSTRAIEAARPGLDTMVQLLRPVVTE